MTPDTLVAEELAKHLGFPNAEAMKYGMGGRLPAPDTVFEQKPLWSRETADELLQARSDVIYAAFGRPSKGA